MLATEAMGMGVEVVGVKTVAQYDSRHITQSVSNLKVLVQRMGRAARASGEEGHFIWFVRPWVLPSLQPNAVPYHAASRLSAVETIVYEEDVAGLQRKSIAARRENMASIYQDLCTKCPRDVLRHFFMPTGSRLSRLPRRQNSRCCFRCQPNLTYVDKSIWTYAKFEEVKAHIERQDSIAQDRNPELKFVLPLDTQLEGKPRLYGRVADALRDWRQREADKMTELYEEEYCPELILPDEELDRLATANIQYSTELGERFIHHFHPNWSRRVELGKMVAELIRKVVSEYLVSMDKQPKRVNQGQVQKVKAQRFEEIAHDRRERYVDRYGDGVDATESQLPGDSVSQWLKARDEPKQNKATKERKAMAAKPSQSQTEEAGPSNAPPEVNKFMAGPDDDGGTQAESPQSVQSTRPPRMDFTQPESQPVTEPSTPTQVNESFVTAREEQLSESSSQPPSRQSESSKPRASKGKRAPGTREAALAHRPSPRSEKNRAQPSSSFIRRDKRVGGRKSTAKQNVQMPPSSDGSDSVPESPSTNCSKRGRRRIESQKLRESRY